MSKKPVSEHLAAIAHDRTPFVSRMTVNTKIPGAKAILATE
jgi:hypothetical protein